MRFSFHHLFYFWHVATTGSIAAAALALHVSQSTISGLIKQLERDLGSKLFRRVGRYLQLTDEGQIAKRYANEIFALGNELDGKLGGAGIGGRPTVRIGVEDVLPDVLVHHLLQPIVLLPERLRIHCRDDTADHLIADLAQQRYDIALVGHPAPPDCGLRIISHQLGESAVSFCASRTLAATCCGPFPSNLAGQPLFMPSPGSQLSRDLAAWFSTTRIKPDFAGEIGDADLAVVFSQSGIGILATPTVVEQSVCQRHDLVVLGRTDEVKVRICALTTERRMRQIGVSTLLASARTLLKPLAIPSLEAVSS